MTHTTLNAIRAHGPCQDGWEKLLKHLGKTKADDEPLAMTTILDSNGIDDANWCLRALGPEHHKLIVGLACDYAEMALEYVPAGETRPAECIRITRLWIKGKATLEEVSAAARSAADAVVSAADAAEAAVAAADARSAWAAANAVNASRAALREKQAKRFREVMEAGR